MKKEKEIIRAIYHKDVEEFFISIGLYDNLKQGKLFCIICGETIKLDNFRAVARKSDKLVFCCDKESCVLAFASYLKGDKT